MVPTATVPVPEIKWLVPDSTKGVITDFVLEPAPAESSRFFDYFVKTVEAIVVRYCSLLGIEASLPPQHLHLRKGRAGSQYLLVDTTQPLELAYTVASTNEPNQQLLLETERLKTLLMAERRAVLRERQRSEELEAQNEKLWDHFSATLKENQSLTAAIVCQQNEKVCFRERHSGAVVERENGTITVSFQTASGETVHQIYDESQFKQKRLPDVGDHIQAHVIVATDQSALDESPTDAELARAFRGFNKGKTGKIIL